MTEPSSGFSDDDLHRWVDGRLDAERAAALEAEMRTNPALAERVQAWRAQREALSELGREWLDEPVPESMRATLDSATPRTPTLDAPGAGGTGGPARGVDAVRWPAANGTWRIAAAVAIVLAAAFGFQAGRSTAPAPAPATAQADTDGHAGVGSGGTGMPTPAGVPGVAADASAPPGFVRAAAVAHGVYVPEVRHPVEVSADQRGHLVAWLSKRLGAQLAAPDLVPEGFELVGGRLLPGERGPSAQLMYQDAQGMRITLYVSRGEGETAATAFRFERVGAVQSFYWIDRGLGYVLSGELRRERLSAVATAVYRELEATPR
ncbi:MAG: anti-sigma factor family protein [Burkholderiales bacterium]|jgi:anti-sigma factor RsiW